MEARSPVSPQDPQYAASGRPGLKPLEGEVWSFLLVYLSPRKLGDT